MVILFRANREASRVALATCWAGLLAVGLICSIEAAPGGPVESCDSDEGSLASSEASSEAPSSRSSVSASAVAGSSKALSSVRRLLPSRAPQPVPVPPEQVVTSKTITVTKSTEPAEEAVTSGPKPSGSLSPSHKLGAGLGRGRPQNSIGESSICGRVPLFERSVRLSINESFPGHTKRRREAESESGEKEDEDEDEGEFRILHGMNALNGEWPWIVKIDICRPGSEQSCSSCTGSLLNSRWVITAGHCAMGRVQNYKGEFGRYDLMVTEKTVQKVTFDKMIVHPEYKDLQNDITLLRLSKPVSFNQNVQPVCVIEERHKDTVLFSKERKCYNIGYGLTVDMVAAVKLQKIEIEVRPAIECNKDKFTVKLRDRELCMGPRKDHVGASCQVSVLARGLGFLGASNLLFAN